MLIILIKTSPLLGRTMPFFSYSCWSWQSHIYYH